MRETTCVETPITSLLAIGQIFLAWILLGTPTVALDLRANRGAGLMLAQGPTVDPNRQGGTRLSPELDKPNPSRDHPGKQGSPPPSRNPVGEASAYKVVGVAADDVLNIRSAPDASSAIVTVIPSNGRGVRAIGNCAGTWCQIEYRGVQGWANSRFLQGE